MFRTEMYDIVVQLNEIYAKTLVETDSKEIALSVTTMFADNLSDTIKELYLETLIAEIKDF
jgi:hypothetical protein